MSAPPPPDPSPRPRKRKNQRQKEKRNETSREKETNLSTSQSLRLLRRQRHEDRLQRRQDFESLCHRAGKNSPPANFRKLCAASARHHPGHQKSPEYRPPRFFG